MNAVCRLLDGPWKGTLEGHDQVDQGPANDDVVVSDNAERGEHWCESDSRKTRVNSSEYTDVTTLEFLTEWEFHKSDGKSNRDQATPVRDEEQGASPFVAEVREPPEVTQADTVSHHSEDESSSTQPSSTFCVCAIVCERFMKAVFAAHVNYFFEVFFLV